MPEYSRLLLVPRLHCLTDFVNGNISLVLAEQEREVEIETTTKFLLRMPMK